MNAIPRLQLACVVCQTPLTGGLDTFGDAGNERCQAHHFNDDEPPGPLDLDAAIAAVEQTLIDLEDEMEDELRSVRDDYEPQIATAEARLEHLKRLKHEQQQLATILL